MNKIEKWEKLTNGIVRDFTEDYFATDEPVDWVEVGGVFELNDYWFSFRTVLDCLKNNVKKDDLIDWYYDSLEGKTHLPLLTYIKSPEIREKERQEYLKVLADRVEEAREILEKELKECR